MNFIKAVRLAVLAYKGRYATLDLDCDTVGHPHHMGTLFVCKDRIKVGRGECMISDVTEVGFDADGIWFYAKTKENGHA